MDTFSKSDPILFLYIKQGNQWQKIGQTEVIHDNLNPQWVTKIAVQYNFERNDQFRVEVYDIDNESQINNTAAQDALGSLEFTLHEVVTCLDQMMKKMLVFPQKPGHKAFVKITAEEMVNNANSEICVFTPEASFVGESSNLYFFIVYKNRGPNQYVPVYKSEVKKYGPNQCVQWN
jgi:copine 5/8/9